MLDYADDLSSFEMLDGSIEVNTIEDLFEHQAYILASLVLDRVRKGLYRGYVEDRDCIPVVRGRINLRETILSSARGQVNLCCEFEEQTEDLEDNQILMWALYCLSIMPFEREAVATAIKDAYQALRGSITIDEKDALDCVGRNYHRLNEDYQPMHALCRFFIDNLGPAFKRGRDIFMPFKLLDMSRVFERFVANWLERNAKMYFIESTCPPTPLNSNAKRGLAFEMDLAVKDRRTREMLAVIDVKYKDTEQPAVDDIAQVVAYATRANVTKAFLVYPTRKTAPIWVKVGKICVQTLICDMNKPDLGASSFLKELDRALAS